MNIGRYSGMISGACRHADFSRWLEGLEQAVLPESGARVIAAGRHLNVAVPAPIGGTTRLVLVKRFGLQSPARTWRDRGRGSKARRTWESASRLESAGVGTPAPIAFLDHWQGMRLTESYYVAEYLDGYVSLREALLELYHETPECARFMDLLQGVADAVHAMHAAGFVHNDLGNQNILLKPGDRGGWQDPRFIDLNRGRWGSPLSLRARGRDLSRLSLPSDLRRVFLEMYWREPPPPALRVWEARYRCAYAVHAGTRRVRHPVREWQLARTHGAGQAYPGPRDLWIWDERSGQAVSALMGNDRTRATPWRRHVWPVQDTLVAFPGVWREYQRLRGDCFQTPVALASRIGMSLDPNPTNWPREMALLDALGPRIPVLIRFYAHEDARRRDCRLAAAHACHDAGHAVMAAVVQDRRAVNDPAGRWRPFLEEVLNGLGGVAREVEVAHAINRVKWGLWDPRELQALYAQVQHVAGDHPLVSFTGPAGIDFEYAFVVSALRRLPKALCFSALSHHLYVDRRGAPENPQGRFSTVEKCALARAIARRAPGCAERLLITGVNWPLLGTGVYSPVGAPYESPGPRFNDPSVTEDTYADYMIRYLCLTLCSGMVERVYWWRLVARGFGLVDDAEGKAWRPRPAYHAMQTFLNQVGDATFQSATLPSGASAPQGVYRFNFQRADGERLAVIYAHGDPQPFPAELRDRPLEDLFGRALASPPAQLTGRPLYMRGLGKAD
jgi:hypothetical protein